MQGNHVFCLNSQAGGFSQYTTSSLVWNLALGWLQSTEDPLSSKVGTLLGKKLSDPSLGLITEEPTLQQSLFLVHGSVSLAGGVTVALLLVWAL